VPLVSSRRRSRLPVVPSAPDGSKLAAIVAGKILHEVIESGWQPGDVMASEPELIERYDISRAVLREAVRLLEHQGVARMRRGPGGGLVVTEPTVDRIIDVAILYLHRIGATLDEVFETRLVLEEIVAELAPQRLDESGLFHLRSLVESEAAGTEPNYRAFHELLASVTGNLALEVFVDILSSVMLLYVPGTTPLTKETLQASTYAHSKIASAVIAGDERTARRRMRAHLEAEAAGLRRRRSTRQRLDPELVLVGPSGSKRAERLARKLLREIVTGKLAPGAMVGMEPELIAAHDASRAVFREAIRILEHHHIATMRRGRRGGLFVTAPNASAVSDVIAIYLVRRGVSVADIAEVRTRVELAVVARIIDDLDTSALDELQRLVEMEQTVPEEDYVERVHDLHTALGAMTGNPVLELVVRVLVRLTRLYQMEVLSAAERQAIQDEIKRTHKGIIDGIVAGDAELARHRMRRHLEAIAAAL